MCIILDASCFGDYRDRSNPDLRPVRQWIRRGGKLAFSPVGKFLRERPPGLVTLQQAGRVRLIPAAEVRDRLASLKNLRSNDAHVVALALTAGIHVLVTRDRELEADFKHVVRGKIYKTKNHRHLLRRDLCP